MRIVMSSEQSKELKRVVDEQRAGNSDKKADKPMLASVSAAVMSLLGVSVLATFVTLLVALTYKLCSFIWSAIV